MGVQARGSVTGLCLPVPSGLWLWFLHTYNICKHHYSVKPGVKHPSATVCRCMYIYNELPPLKVALCPFPLSLVDSFCPNVGLSDQELLVNFVALLSLPTCATFSLV